MNNLEYKDLLAESKYQHDLLTVREIDVKTKEAVIANKFKDISDREYQLKLDNDNLIEK